MNIIPRGFSASDEWIGSIINTTETIASCDDLRVKNSGKIFELLAALLSHDSLRSTHLYHSEISRVRSTGSVLNLANGTMWLPTRSITSFLTCSRALIDPSLRFRTGPIRIKTSNPFMTNFSPTESSRVQGAIRQILRKGGSAWSNSTSDEHRALLAVKIYFLIITVHPFWDMNGRTARLYFGAHARLLGSVSSAVLLAFIVMHRNFSNNFLTACKFARSGDFSFILREFEHGLSDVRTHFQPLLEHLTSLIQEGDSDARVNELLDEVRSKAVGVIFPTLAAY